MYCAIKGELLQKKIKNPGSIQESEEKLSGKRGLEEEEEEGIKDQCIEHKS